MQMCEQASWPGAGAALRAARVVHLLSISNVGHGDTGVCTDRKHAACNDRPIAPPHCVVSQNRVLEVSAREGSHAPLVIGDLYSPPGARRTDGAWREVESGFEPKRQNQITKANNDSKRKQTNSIA